MAQRQHEEDEAESVAQEPDQSGDGKLSRRKAESETGRESERQDEVHATGDEALQHGDQDRVEQGDLAGQIVVDGPGEAGPRNGQRTQQAAIAGTDRLNSWGPGPWPGEDDRPRGHSRHAEGDPPVDILAEDEPGDERGQDRFKVEEQRGGGGPGETEPGQEQNGAEHAAGEDRPQEPGPVRPARRGLPGKAGPKQPPGEPEQSEPDAAAEIE